MSRYIKFDDAVKIMACVACEMYAEAQSQGYDVDGIEDFMPEAKAWIADAPSIDICFCRECKLGGTEDCPMDEIDDEYFCNFGEREGK